MSSTCSFLVDTYETERLKTLSVWATCRRPPGTQFSGADDPPVRQRKSLVLQHPPNADVAPTIYAYTDIDALLEAVAQAGNRASLPVVSGAVTERPQKKDRGQRTERKTPPRLWAVAALRSIMCRTDGQPVANRWPTYGRPMGSGRKIRPSGLPDISRACAAWDHTS